MINIIPLICGLFGIIMGIIASYRQERFAFEIIFPALFLVVFFSIQILTGEPNKGDFQNESEFVATLEAFLAVDWKGEQ
jgi:hypothetical protein